VKATVIAARFEPLMDDDEDVQSQPGWMLLAESDDERLDGPREFVSPRLWDNPMACYPLGSEVTVVCLPDDPREYVFELDRLPRPKTSLRGT